MRSLLSVYGLSEETLGNCSPSQNKCKRSFKYGSITFHFPQSVLMEVLQN